MRVIIPTMMLLTLAANPSFAKDSHAPHGVRASTTSTTMSGKARTHASPLPSKTSVPIDELRETVAPPVLPPHAVTRHQTPIINPTAKTSVNAPRGQAGTMTNPLPAVRNAIGQPVIMPKNFVGGQHGATSVQPGLGVAAPTIVPATADRLNVAIAANRGGANGAAPIRPVASSGIGGPAPQRYGINGTTVQTRH